MLRSLQDSCLGGNMAHGCYFYNHKISLSTEALWMNLLRSCAEHRYVFGSCQVSGCQDHLEDITAGSEMLLLTSESGTAPYQSFLFSSTLFSASSWLSKPRGGVSLISLICSHPFSLSFACCHQCGTRSSLCVPGRAAPVLPALPSRGCLVPCSRLPASLV